MSVLVNLPPKVPLLCTESVHHRLWKAERLHYTLRIRDLGNLLIGISLHSFNLWNQVCLYKKVQVAFTDLFYISSTKWACVKKGGILFFWRLWRILKKTQIVLINFTWKTFLMQFSIYVDKISSGMFYVHKNIQCNLCFTYPTNL